MSSYPIRLYGDPILRRQATLIPNVHSTFTVPGFLSVSLSALAANMFETMYEAGGVGLAAPQIGLSIRLFVAVDYNDDAREGVGSPKARVKHEFVMLNPTLEVLDVRQEARYDDGCLSIPGIYEPGVNRSRAVRLRYLDEHGEACVTEADDYLARVFQHEFEHLDGRIYLDHLPIAVKQRHRAYLADLQRKSRAYLKRLT